MDTATTWLQIIALFVCGVAAGVLLQRAMSSSPRLPYVAPLVVMCLLAVNLAVRLANLSSSIRIGAAVAAIAAGIISLIFASGRLSRQSVKKS